MIRAAAFASILLSLAAASFGAAAGVEVYSYQSVPTSGDEDRREDVQVRITRGDDGYVYAFTIVSKGRSETGTISTLGDGSLVGAVRTVREGAEVVRDSLWIDRGKLYASRLEDGDSDVKEIGVPDDKTIAVDASSLIWMRTLDTRRPGPWELFMVDFSRRTVDVTVHDRGIEEIEVPAGVFECRHIEVVVKVLIFRPRVHFWITADEPHFMVKHEGKRGPFTPTYITTLTKVGPGE